jgi:D-sedoheptulose 7-phosphate isomerase
MSATVVARALGIKVVGLTGAKGGELASVADVCVKAPSNEPTCYRNCTFRFTTAGA